ncbi:MAG TPA: DUF1697 domain-containing protein, partial [Emcibacteraceae bacterium]|nr:DUF1697 domain-containing protein [Emcibacteraceae bacterium]
MDKFISILRGINVSGQKSIKMTDLKTLYESKGAQNVTTYIQSGNVIFNHTLKDPDQIKNQIEQAIETQYNFSVHVDVRNALEFCKVLEELPFKEFDPEQDGTKILITFLDQNPDKALKEKLLDYVKEPEKLIFGNRAIYLHCPNGYGKTKLSNLFIENKLKTKATTRNLKSV